MNPALAWPKPPMPGPPPRAHSLFATNTSGTTGLLARALDVPGNVSLGATLSRSTSATFAVLAAVAVGLGRTEYEANINAFTNNVLVTLDATRTRGTEIPFQVQPHARISPGLASA